MWTTVCMWYLSDAHLVFLWYVCSIWEICMWYLSDAHSVNNLMEPEWPLCTIFLPGKVFFQSIIHNWKKSLLTYFPTITRFNLLFVLVYFIETSSFLFQEMRYWDIESFRRDICRKFSLIIFPSWIIWGLQRCYNSFDQLNR